MQDLFSRQPKRADDYSARDIEVLEGLEPIRRRPGMYVGGTDERALHHLVVELVDNAMDEVVEGHATWIEIELAADGTVTVRDNGRGIPVEPHPKFPKISTLELVLTTLHSGGKFSGLNYKTSAGLHGIGLSAVNALGDRVRAEVARDRQLWAQEFRRGKPTGPIKNLGPVQNRRGTAISCHPDPQIFGDARFSPDRMYRLARSKAYLSAKAEVRWRCAPSLLKPDDKIPAEAVLHFPGGLVDFLAAQLEERPALTALPFAGRSDLPDLPGASVEWAIAWPEDEEAAASLYCNTVPTPQGGTHEQGLRSGLLRGAKAFAEHAGNRRAQAITADDVLGGAVVMLSLFLPDAQFQGQTKERLTSDKATRPVEAAVKDHFEHWLSGDPAAAQRLLDRLIERAEERARRRAAKEQARQSATRKLRLPGKLTDCSSATREGSEIFLVEGNSAGGSAKSARNRETQAILPLRGKILNVASASADKLAGNQEIADLTLALGCGTRDRYDEDKLRYDRVVIMTDADVDGAHIAALLMTFFYREMRGLIENGHLFLAQPPLYRLQAGGVVAYARDDAHKAELLRTTFAGKKVETSRFKGLGEMPAAQLRDTTMDPAKRTLWQVALGDAAAKEETASLVEQLMGRKPELRLRFIQDNAPAAKDLDV